MARPSQENSEIIIVNCDGRILVWCNGALSGDDDMRREAERATRLNLPIEVSQRMYVFANHKNVENPQHVIAAMVAYNPGRTFIQEISDRTRLILEQPWEEQYVQNV